MKGFMLFIIMLTAIMIFFVLDRDRKVQQNIYDKAVKIYEVITNDNTKGSI